MTRTARMPKKKYLDASSWDEMRPKNEEIQNDGDSQHTKDENPNLFEQVDKKNKKKSQKRERERNTAFDESMTLNQPTSNEETPKKKKKKKDFTKDEDEADIVNEKKQIKSTKDKTDNNNEISKKENDNTEPEEESLQKNKKKKKLKESHSVKCKSEPKLIDSSSADEVSNVNKSNNNFQAKTKGVKRSFKSRREEKLEKQGEARRKRRAKRKGFLTGVTCFNCRQTGHTAIACPKTNKERSGVGVCYTCGSTGHTTKNCKKDTTQDENPFPFAKCFICGETGHLSRSCPDNPKGLYPEGGCCNMCGSVEHLRRDCPDAIRSKASGKNPNSGINYKIASIYSSADAEIHSDDEARPMQKKFKNKRKFVKF